MALLALVAMLLLLALPMSGRLLSSSSAASDGGVWAQMCTMAGLKLVKIAPSDANPLDAPAVPKSPTGSTLAGEDCPYCPLLGSMVVLLLCLVFALPQPAPTVRSPWRLVSPRAFLHPSGLGSRGPPFALCKA